MKTYVGDIRSKEKKTSYVIGDSRLNEIYFKSFSGANANQLDYYVVPVLVDEKRNNVLIPED